MPKFIVIRWGSNGANQPMCDRAVVGLVIAPTEDKALDAAQDNFHCYNNQCLEIVQAKDASRHDKLAARELEGEEIINLIEQEKDLETWVTS